jgi:hypothetical protein
MILREQGPYFTCGRCQHKVPIEKMVWDNGLLVCAPTEGLYCSADGAINGSLELRWAREVGRDRQELTPEPKLINPLDPATQLETVPASSGVFE